MLSLVFWLMFYFDPGAATHSHLCLQRPAVATAVEHTGSASDRCRLLVRMSPSLPEGEQPREYPGASRW
jgi:hypothetical protein